MEIIFLMFLIDAQCPQRVSFICNFGSFCMMNLNTNMVSCECDISCNTFDPMHLCGNDGVSYPSFCHLKQAKCLQQKAIRVVNHDRCGKS